ncbi:hypothetical protein LOTGIDRAFT_175623 [Lottia gigantea]|uniref:Cadherin domain-containing protein n=1 Tax=Lottia gigantea TaxID=225164 RepID=V3ZNL4_LOTGI|nr:hypothetical protein LOTGIDRAFT_175623 [Lottia gigantea]ESO92958.1 hypothetical protein LOTGIDRAFT_175623 [Lottia gigantea]
MPDRQMITYVLMILCFRGINSQGEITLSNPVVNIVETATADTQIGNIQTTESSCKITNTTPRKGPFDLSNTGSSYDVIFKYGRGYTKLDYSKTPTYILHIQCGSAKEDLEVDVHPNSPPKITDWPSVTITKFKAKETAEDTFIYKVPASDIDGDTLTYTMYSDPDLGYFSIDETTGKIVAAVDLNLATVDVIPLKVNVSDGKNTVGPFSIFVRLKDLNSRPEFTNLPTNVSIKEDAEAGDTVLQLSISDDGPTNNLKPVCSVFPNSENYKFNYEPSTQKLKLAKVPDGDTLLDFETTKFYNITCKINDGYLDNQGDYINLYVENVNEEPIFNQELYTCNLYESKAGVSTCDLPMTITEPEDQKFDTILLPGNNSKRFTLTSDTNKLTFQTTYDVDDNVMPDQVILTVAAVDSRGKTGTSKIQVNIRDVNDNAPDFGSVEPVYSIGADTSLGVLGNVVADDIDDGSNGEVTYSLTGGSAQALAYVNVLRNGEVCIFMTNSMQNVRYSNQYDYSLAGQTHYLEVTAKDKGSPQKTSTTTIAVLFQTTTTTPVPPTNTPVIVLNNGGSSSNSQTASSTSFLDDSTNVGLLAALLSLLALAGLAALLCCCCRGSNSSSCFSGGQSKSFCDCFSSRPRIRKVKQIVEEPEPEIIEEKPKQVVVEEFVEEPRMVSYTPSVISYNNSPEYVTDVVPYTGYDRGYYRY